MKPGSGIFEEMQGPQLSKNNYRIVLAKSVGGLRVIDNSSPGYDNVRPVRHYSDVDSIDALVERGVNYIVLSNYVDQMRNSRFSEKYTEELKKYESLSRSSELLFDTDSISNTRGPRLRVYDINVMRSNTAVD